MTPQEEKILQDIVRERMPMTPVNPQTGIDTSDTSVSVGQHIKKLMARVTAPLPVIAGSAPVPTDNRITPKIVGDDEHLLAKTSHVRKPNEGIMAFVARTGLGVSQIRTMSKDEIRRFVEVVAQNEQIAEPAKVAGVKPSAAPRGKIFVDSWQ
jgi:hypothetical protein